MYYERVLFGLKDGTNGMIVIFYFLSFITAIIGRSCFCRDIANAKSCFYTLCAIDKSLRLTEQRMFLLSCILASDWLLKNFGVPRLVGRKLSVGAQAPQLAHKYLYRYSSFTMICLAECVSRRNVKLLQLLVYIQIQMRFGPQKLSRFRNKLLLKACHAAGLVRVLAARINSTN